MNSTQPQNQMREGRFFLIIALAAITLTAAALTRSIRIRGEAQHASAPIPLRADSKILTSGAVSYAGNQSATNTLLIFTDYQCPACKQLDKGLISLMKHHPADLRVAVRHFPLKMHRYATEAAIAAELARRRGKFWVVHEELMNKRQVSLSAIEDVAARSGVVVKHGTPEYTAAAAAVSHDVQLGRAIGVNATPTLVVAIDGRGAWLVRSLQQVELVIKRPPLQ